MNDEGMFDPKEMRKMQLEAVKYCYKQDILTAKIQFRDRMRRLDYTRIKYIARKYNLLLELSLGITPVVFLEN